MINGLRRPFARCSTLVIWNREPLNIFDTSLAKLIKIKLSRLYGIDSAGYPPISEIHFLQFVA